jgi:tetratricopeptide (TPR) repeat protein
MAMVKDHPIVGVGLGNFFIYHPLYHRAYLRETHRLDRHHVMRAHNDFVQVLAELGIVGLLLIIWLGYRVVLVGMNSAYKAESSRTGLISVCVFAAVIGIAVNGFFSFPFQNSVPPLLLLLFLAILGWYAERRVGERRIASVNSWQWIYSFAVVALLVFGVGVVLQVQRLRGDHFLLEGLKHENARDWERAVSAGESSYVYNRYPVGLRFRLGQYYIETEQHRNAITMLKSGLGSHPYYATGFYNLGLAHFRIKEYKKALSNFKRAVDIYPELDQAHHMLGATLLELGDLEGTEKSVRLALSLNATDPSYYFTLGRAYLRQRRFKDARTYLEVAVNAEPSNAAHQLVAGMAHEANGLVKTAAERYRLALRHNPGWAEAHMRLGLILLQLGEKEEGIANLARALERNPHASWAADVRSKLKSLGAEVDDSSDE